MRVLSVVTSLAVEWGGPAKAVVSLTEELAQKGVECCVFATNVPRGGSFLRPLGVEVRLFGASPLAGWWRGHSWTLGKALLASVRQFDLLHIHEPWNYPHFAAWRCAMRWDKPYVVTIHGSLEPAALRFKWLRKQLYFWMVQRRILAGASVLHAITEAEERHIRALGLQNPVAMIPNGVHLEEFAFLPDRFEFETRYSGVSGRTVLLFMGRLHPIKGLGLLAEAYASVARQRDDVCLVIAGPDEAGIRSQLERKLAAEVARGRVIFTGLLGGRERLAAFSRADIFVLPAQSEVRGLVTLEAMACNLPVVLTRECGFPEISQAQAGIIVPSTVADLAAAITRLAENANLRRMLGRNGRQLVERHYTWTRVADQMISLYRSVLDDPLHRPKAP